MRSSGMCAVTACASVGDRIQSSSSTHFLLRCNFPFFRNKSFDLRGNRHSSVRSPVAHLTVKMSGCLKNRLRCPAPAKATVASRCFLSLTRGLPRQCVFGARRVLLLRDLFRAPLALGSALHPVETPTYPPQCGSPEVPPRAKSFVAIVHWIAREHFGCLSLVLRRAWNWASDVMSLHHTLTHLLCVLLTDEDTKGMKSALLQMCQGIISRLPLIARVPPLENTFIRGRFFDGVTAITPVPHSFASRHLTAPS